MIFVNETLKDEDYSKGVLENFLLLLAPYAPHIAEELWQRLGHSQTLAYEAWPEFDEQYLEEAVVELAVLIRGKVRAKITVSKQDSQQDIEKQALADETVQSCLENQKIKKVIVVPGRIVNIVV